MASLTLPAAAALAAVCVPLAAGVGLVVRPGTDRPAGRPAGTTTVPPGLVRAGLCWSALVVALWAAVAGLAPPSVPVAVVAVLVVAVAVSRAGPGGASGTVGSHTSLAVAVVAVVAVVAAAVLAPLASLPLPDIGVLGPYTYLATEVAFGAVTLALLVRAGRDAIRSTALTVAAVYPVAYVWDWYTLEVGVFSIPLRTGLTFAGIPVEEHLFMVVVPAFVLAVRETVVPLASE